MKMKKQKKEINLGLMIIESVFVCILALSLFWLVRFTFKCFNGMAFSYAHFRI